MELFEVTVLGSGSATPSLIRNPSAQLLNASGHFFLIDCGEGTQIQLRKNSVKLQRIGCILISHLHGDHYFGLTGLLQTMHLLGRKTKVTLICPPELKEIIDLQNKHSQTGLSFELEYIFTDPKNQKKVYENNSLEVYSFPLNHRINCTGFLFKEKVGLRKIIKEKLQKHKISVAEINNLRLGFDAKDENGKTVLNKDLTHEPLPVRSFAYCSDTVYDEKIIPFVKGVNLLYHETTFLEAEIIRAKKTFHTTAMQAANIAKRAGAKQLLIGHFSARYGSTTDFLKEAQPVFENTLIAEEGMTFKIL
ncbi:MAG TPA: ribonuclease Z [Bacteroidia bacterium]|jgi:ribonuclease Z|nr:ribonuclease Z [Bacteroidia bacterium]